MTRGLPSRLLAFVLASIVIGGVASAQSPADLPIGQTATGQVSDATTYRYAASGAGVLTVAVHADADVTVTVTDAEGQALPEGMSDQDLFGSGGNEQIAVSLPEAGEYRVVVRLLGSGASRFDIGGSWIPMPAFARATDPDRRPSMATRLEVGRSHEDALDTDAGDHWDWFTITPATAGTLTVILRSTTEPSPDLALELYTNGNFERAAVRSDDDLQGNTTNESASVDVAAGEPVLVKVLGALSRPVGPYRIASSLIE